MGDAEVLRAILAAYKTIMEASWPALHPGGPDRTAEQGRRLFAERNVKRRKP